jgi:hypothetical protein
MHAFSSVTPPLDFYINQRHRHRADSGLGGFFFVRPCHSARFMQSGRYGRVGVLASRTTETSVKFFTVHVVMASLPPAVTVTGGRMIGSRSADALSSRPHCSTQLNLCSVELPG